MGLIRCFSNGQPTTQHKSERPTRRRPCVYRTALSTQLPQFEAFLFIRRSSATHSHCKLSHITFATARMVYSRATATRNETFHKNAQKRGAVPSSLTKKAEAGAGPFVIGFFLFVVVGSAVLQIVSTATAGPRVLSSAAENSPNE